MEENNKMPIQLIRKAGKWLNRVRFYKNLAIADYHLHPMKLIEPPNVQPVIGVGIIDDKIVAILPDNIYSLRECYLDETNRPHISTNLVRGIMIIDGDISILQRTMLLSNIQKNTEDSSNEDISDTQKEVSRDTKDLFRDKNRRLKTFKKKTFKNKEN